MRASSRRKRGQSAIELAISLSMFVAVFFVIVDVAFGLSAQVQVTNAVREGARLARTVWSQPDGDTQVQNRVLALVGAVVHSNLGTPTISYPGGKQTGGSVQVQLACSYGFFVPSFLGGGGMNCGSTATTRIE